MTGTLAREKEERFDAEGKTPHLSYSRIQRYLTCPEQYRLYYIERLRPLAPSASLVFGQVIHQCIAGLLRKQASKVGQVAPRAQLRELRATLR